MSKQNKTESNITTPTSTTRKTRSTEPLFDASTSTDLSAEEAKPFTTVSKQGALAILLESIELGCGKQVDGDLKRLTQAVSAYNSKSDKHFIVRPNGSAIVIVRNDIKRIRKPRA